MSKIKINYCLIHDGEINKLDTIGKKESNQIFFKDKDVDFKITLSDPLSLIRSSIDYEISMTLKQSKLTEGSYKIKDIGKFDLKIKTLELKQSEKDLYIRYELFINDENSGSFELKLNYEVIK